MTAVYMRFARLNRREGGGVTLLVATRKLALDYGTPVYPDTYIIDRNGKIARKFYGPQQWDSPGMLAYFDSIIGKS